MKQVGEHGSGTRGRLLPRLAALGVLAMAFGAPWPLAQAATGGEVSLVPCAPEEYKCVANDAQGAISVTAEDIPSCTVGEWVDVPVTIQATTSGNSERLDIGAWFLSSTAGQCQNVMTTATNVDGQFRNVDGDTCGDMSGSATASQSFWVKVQCNPDANGVVTFPTLAYWSNNKNPNTCNAFPAGRPKCTKSETTVNVAAIKGKITVKKTAADAATLPFTFNVTGGTTQTFSLTAGGTPKVIEADATKNGTNYTITETPPAGWQFIGASCSTATGVPVGTSTTNGITVPVTFAASEISCTFSNARIPPTNQVTLVKDLTADDGGQFTYTLGTQTSLPSGGSGDKLTGQFQAGTKVVFGEAAAPGINLNHYTRTYSCVQGTTPITLTNEATDSRSFTMPATEGGVTCTIKNERKSRLVKIDKVLNDPVTTNAATFNLLLNGTLTASGVRNYTDTAGTPVAVGSEVTVSEQAVSGSLSDYTAQLSCPNVNPITITQDNTEGVFNMPDADVTCTFTNTRISAKLKVAKAWADGFTAGDKATVTTTGFINTASSGESTAGTGTTGAEVTVYAGETGQLIETFSAGTMANYTQSYACSGGVAVGAEGNISIAAADKDKTITCTLTNTRKRASVRITKSSSVPGPVAPGSELTYTVVVRNTGQIALGGQPISDPMPADVASQTWTCSGTGGATCNPASGDGDVTGTVNLPVGGEVTYTIKARLKDTLTAAVTNIARVVVPPGTSCEEPQEQQAARERPANVVVNPVVCEAEASNPPAPPAPAAVTPVPTTSPEGLAALALMMLGVAGWAARRHGKRK